MVAFPRHLVRVALCCLILASSAFSQTATLPMGKFPALKVDAVVGTKQRNRSGSFYEKTMQIEPKMTIEGATQTTAIPAAEAVMMVVTMDTEAKYTASKNVFTVHTTQTLPIPEAASGVKRTFEFEGSTVVFDTARDASNIGGAIYKYYVFALRDPQTKEIIDFQTNFATLATFCKAHPEKRANILGLAKGAKFPSEFR
jgi:hypothetical protein